MQKRKFDRINLNLKVKFFCDDILCSGVINNFSEKGMLIRTKMSFPFDGRFDIFILLKDQLLKVPVEIIRLSKADRHYDIMALEVLGHPQEYNAFVSAMKSFYRSSPISLSESFRIKRRLCLAQSKSHGAKRNSNTGKSMSNMESLPVVSKTVIKGNSQHN